MTNISEFIGLNEVSREWNGAEMFGIPFAVNVWGDKQTLLFPAHKQECKLFRADGRGETWGEVDTMVEPIANASETEKVAPTIIVWPESRRRVTRDVFSCILSRANSGAR